jgi:hypothetical protein
MLSGWILPWLPANAMLSNQDAPRQAGRRRQVPTRAPSADGTGWSPVPPGSPRTRCDVVGGHSPAEANQKKPGRQWNTEQRQPDPAACVPENNTRRRRSIAGRSAPPSHGRGRHCVAFSKQPWDHLTPICIRRSLLWVDNLSIVIPFQQQLLHSIPFSVHLLECQRLGVN